MVADEVWRVLGDDHALAEGTIGERDDRVQHRAIGLGRRDHFEQVQVARRVEEMRAEPVTAGSRRCVLRRARRWGSPDVFELTMLPGRLASSTRASSCALDVELLDDGFEDPVDVFESREVRRRSSPS